MNVKNIDIKKLKPYEKNPRKNKKAVEAVANSIKEFGFKVPIVIDKENVIVCGHTRFKAAQQLGIETVPCVVADDLTDEQTKAFRLADNKTAELADWDFDLLETEIENLDDIDMSLFGFDVDEGEESLAGITEDEFCEDISAPATAKAGDLWKLGGHFLFCGDATKREDVGFLMQGNLANLVVTDPPYNVAYEGRTKDKLTIQNDSMKESEFYDFLFAAFCNIQNVLLTGGVFYIYYASAKVVNFVSAATAAGLRVSQHLIWVKNIFAAGFQDYRWKHEPILYGWKEGAAHTWNGKRNKGTVLEEVDFGDLKSKPKEFLLKYIEEFNMLIKTSEIETDIICENKPMANRIHPTMKPVKLLARNITNSSNLGDIVLDVFGGSGSTLIACEQTGRRCFMMEYDPKYCDAIIRRWEEFTGEKAVLINGK